MCNTNSAFSFFVVFVWSGEVALCGHIISFCTGCVDNMPYGNVFDGEEVPEESYVWLHVVYYT